MASNHLKFCLFSGLCSPIFSYLQLKIGEKEKNVWIIDMIEMNEKNSPEIVNNNLIFKIRFPFPFLFIAQHSKRDLIWNCLLVCTLISVLWAEDTQSKCTLEQTKIKQRINTKYYCKQFAIEREREREDGRKRETKMRKISHKWVYGILYRNNAKYNENKKCIFCLFWLLK